VTLSIGLVGKPRHSWARLAEPFGADLIGQAMKPNRRDMDGVHLFAGKIVKKVAAALGASQMHHGSLWIKIEPPVLQRVRVPHSRIRVGWEAYEKFHVSFRYQTV
jgi:hypothetical protein